MLEITETYIEGETEAVYLRPDEFYSLPHHVGLSTPDDRLSAHLVWLRGWYLASWGGQNWVYKRVVAAGYFDSRLLPECSCGCWHYFRYGMWPPCTDD